MKEHRSMPWDFEPGGPPMSEGLSPGLLDELAGYIRAHGMRVDVTVSPAEVSGPLRKLIGAPLPRKPKAVAFDVYGTLLAGAQAEPGAVGEARMASVAEFSGIRFPPDLPERLSAIIASDHAAARKRGVPWPEVDAVSVFMRALDMDAERAARACVAWECAVNPCSPMPGATAFLDACKLAGLPLAIVSNAQFYTPLFIRAAFGKGLWGPDGLGFDPDLTFWSCRGLRAKPDTRMYLSLVRELKDRSIDAPETLYVGNDALNDCATAGEAGLMTALFAGDARSCMLRDGDPRVAAMPPTTVILYWDLIRTGVWVSET
ncbi:MAG: HAD family hydrolase [Spirochaetales bacterium]|nr:MAG: HAD family hydrolase [Spirochaetales bacterium]